jgi:DNA-binding FadR family transcriptional regulator
VKRDKRQDTGAATGSGLGRLTGKIVDELGTAIVTGEYQPDALLPSEIELAHHYAASRSVMREAVKVLNAKGLVTAKPRRGTSVTSSKTWNLFDPDVLRWILRRNFSLPLMVEFTEIRIGIEPMAAELAARFADPAAVGRIRAAFERMVAASRGEDDPLESDIAFHLSILDASNNRFIARLKPLVEAALNFSIRYTDNIVRDEEAKIEQHRLVLDAIVSGDLQGAHRGAHDLLVDVRRLLDHGMRGSPEITAA